MPAEPPKSDVTPATQFPAAVIPNASNNAGQTAIPYDQFLQKISNSIGTKERRLLELGGIFSEERLRRFKTAEDWQEFVEKWLERRAATASVDDLELYMLSNAIKSWIRNGKPY